MEHDISKASKGIIVESENAPLCFSVTLLMIQAEIAFEEFGDGHPGGHFG